MFSITLLYALKIYIAIYAQKLNIFDFSYFLLFFSFVKSINSLEKKLCVLQLFGDYLKYIAKFMKYFLQLFKYFQEVMEYILGLSHNVIMLQ